MKLKNILLIFFILGTIFNKISAQNKVECEKIVIATVDAINNKTPEQVEKFLAPDFTFSGQQAPIAKVVLNQLIKQLKDKVKDYQKTSEVENNGNLTLTYEFNYDDKLGKKTSTFIFNSNNQLKQLDLFSIQVKTMEKDETQIEKNEEQFIIIPIEIRNNIPLVKAIVNGETKTFILDNGSPRLILNSKYFKENNDQNGISNVQGINTSVSNLDIMQLKDFDFYGIKIKDSKALTMDISHLEKTLETDIYGLIGYEVYKDYDILFDYKNKQVIFIQPNYTEKYISKEYNNSKIEEIPIEMNKHLPTAKVKIANKYFQLGLDSGASGNMLDKKFFDSMRSNLSKLENRDVAGAGETKTAISGNLKEILIGNKKFRNTHTVFNDMSHLNTAYKINLDGFIGYDILSQQKILVEFQNKRLLLID